MLSLPGLAAIGRANLRKATHARAKVLEIVTANATTWQPPDDLTIVYLCDSVQGACDELPRFKIDVAWNQARPIQTAMPTAQGSIYICWML